MICGIMASQGVAIACARPLDANVSELTGVIGVNGKLTASMSDQKGSYTTAGAAGLYGMAQAGILAPASTFSNTTGKKAIEWVITAPASSGGAVVLSSAIGDADNFTVIEWELNAQSNGTFDFYGQVRSGTLQVSASSLGLGSAPARVRLYMDGDAGTHQWYLDSTSLTMAIPTLYEAATLNFQMYIQEFSSVPASTVYAIELITNASGMTGTYPSGTTDICGNTL